jgi:hypothetical protein
MKMSDIKNWILGGGGAVALIVFMAFVDWRIGVKIDEALGSQDIGTDAKIVSMDTEIDENGAHSQANTTRIEGNERRVEQAFGVLMGRPPPE